MKHPCGADMQEVAGSPWRVEKPTTKGMILWMQDNGCGGYGGYT
jgi:hypothetical protein